MTTLLDVARHADVSSATVSRVLNGLDGVSDAVRDRVLESVKVLNYEPNRMAQGLKSRRGRTVGFLVADIEQQWYSTLTKQLQASISALQLDLMLIDLRHSTFRLEKVLRTAQELGLRAVGFATSRPIPLSMLVPAVEACHRNGIVVFSIDQDLTEAGVPSIIHNDEEAAVQGVTHMVDAGCEDIVYLGGRPNSVTAIRRYSGYVRGLEKLERRSSAALVIKDRYRYAAGYYAVCDALAAGRKFDGILAGSDEMALGAVSALADTGVTVPGDVSVVGFGGMEFGEYVRPALTTLAGNPHKVAEHVSTLIAAPLSSDRGRLLTIDRELIVRGTVRSPLATDPVSTSEGL